MNYISGTASVDYAYSGGILSTISRGGYLPGNTTTKYTLTYKVDPNLGGTLESDRSYGYTYGYYKKAESVQKT